MIAENGKRLSESTCYSLRGKLLHYTFSLALAKLARNRGCHSPGSSLSTPDVQEDRGKYTKVWLVSWGGMSRYTVAHNRLSGRALPIARAEIADRVPLVVGAPRCLRSPGRASRRGQNTVALREGHGILLPHPHPLNGLHVSREQTLSCYFRALHQGCRGSVCDSRKTLLPPPSPISLAAPPSMKPKHVN